MIALRIVASGLVASACSPTQPGTRTIVIPNPSIVCPTPSPVQTGTPQPVTVTYGAPSVTHGTQPVSVTCTPSSGSSFPVGSTTVTCTATDAVRRTASCMFQVVVVFVPPPPRLNLTRFLAFGDSITAGSVPDGTFPGRFRALQLLPSNLTYPGQLEMMLKARYTTQTPQIVVVNRGVQLERATEGQARLPRELAAYTPDVLLLLEGVNDLNTGNPGSSLSAAIAALRSMIIQARGNNVRVLISTLLPERPGGSGAGAINLIVPFNNQLVPMATAEGAVVVDVYDAFLPHVPDWIGVDGLHPNETGYQALAQLFFNAIKGAYETPGSMSTPTRSTPLRTLPR